MIDQAILADNGPLLDARRQHTIPHTNPRMVVSNSLDPLISPPFLEVKSYLTLLHYFTPFPHIRQANNKRSSEKIKAGNIAGMSAFSLT
jgi:hypothetical protein